MENKTINDLNNKPWYRSLKVIYLLFCIVGFVVVVLGFSSWAYYLYQDKQEFTKKRDKTNQQLKLIKEQKNKGYTTEQILKEGTVNLFRASPEVYKELYGEEEYNKLNFNSPKEPSMLGLLLIVPGLLASWVVLQIPKWIFYYIYFGTIRPKINGYKD